MHLHICVMIYTLKLFYKVLQAKEQVIACVFWVKTENYIKCSAILLVS